MEAALVVPHSLARADRLEPAVADAHRAADSASICSISRKGG